MAKKAKKSQTRFFLYTGFAKRLIKGRKADRSQNIYPIHGFEHYTKKVRVLWDDAQANNPYAIWFLKRISDMLEESAEYIAKQEALTSERFDDVLDIDYRKYDKKNKEHFSLNLKPPYSWKMARLIKRADLLFLDLFKQNSVGLITDHDMYVLIDDVSKSLLSVIRLANSYYHFEVTEKDVASSSQVFVTASEKMGVIPPSILTGEQKADYLPKFRATA